MQRGRQARRGEQALLQLCYDLFASSSFCAFGLPSWLVSMMPDGVMWMGPVASVTHKRSFSCHFIVQVEGIFRVAGDSQLAMQLRKSVSLGHVPSSVDVHTLAGLIKVKGKEYSNNNNKPIDARGREQHGGGNSRGHAAGFAVLSVLSVVSGSGDQ